MTQFPQATLGDKITIQSAFRFALRPISRYLHENARVLSPGMWLAVAYLSAGSVGVFAEKNLSDITSRGPAIESEPNPLLSRFHIYWRRGCFFNIPSFLLLHVVYHRLHPKLQAMNGTQKATRKPRLTLFVFIFLSHQFTSWILWWRKQPALVNINILKPLS
ncbi:hypothetical protein F4821DRAFT_230511 [Hypoxylon rubiginosum]|uniref:Uncharacterized protein n=1 Tax=Hypoxylon rubiginosum TaxID=110542 RepID=A0ACC0DA35_9PEZI|nr:hypothetical protein F4821DRAFT_230511 [Hypoxylon rubiginosum]